MTAGLQIWSASGQLLLDDTHRVARVLAVVPLTGGSGVASHYSDDRLLQGTPLVAFQCNQTFYLNTARANNPAASLMQPAITTSGNTVSWAYPSGLYAGADEYASGVLVIGVY